MPSITVASTPSAVGRIVVTRPIFTPRYVTEEPSKSPPVEAIVTVTSLGLEVNGRSSTEANR